MLRLGIFRTSINKSSLIDWRGKMKKDNYSQTEYEYDKKGNIDTIKTSNYELPEFSINQMFEYDAADQIIIAIGSKHDVPTYSGNIYHTSFDYGNYGRINANKTSISDPQTANNYLMAQSNAYSYPSANSAPSTSFAPLNANWTGIIFEYGINVANNEIETK